MRDRLLVPLLIGILSLSATADDSVRSAQESLQDLGFYTETPSGTMDATTQGAIRRFQIYKGLEATGTLDAKTQEALKEKEPGDPAPAGAMTPTPPATPTSPPAPAPPTAPIAAAENGDREFLEEQNRPAPAPPQAAPSVSFGDFYLGTPYHNAPPEVQRETLRKAQTLLAQRRLFDANIDGLPGADTEESLFRYQSGLGLKLSGRLDLETLAQMRLLPQTRKASAPPKKRSYQPPATVPGRGPVYQGRLPGASPDGAVRGIRLD